MPQLSRFPVKKEESETICLARKKRGGRRARDAMLEKISAWGKAIVQQAAKGDECPAMSPHRQTAEAAACRDDRCFQNHPTGNI